MYYLGSLLYLLSFDLLLCLFLLDFFCCSLLHFYFGDFLVSLSFVAWFMYTLLCFGLVCFVLLLFCLFSFFLLFDFTLPFCFVTLTTLLCLTFFSWFWLLLHTLFSAVRFALVASWLTRRLFGWLEGWMSGWSVCWLDRLFVCLTRWMVDWLADWLSCDVMICRAVSWRV